MGPRTGFAIRASDVLFRAFFRPAIWLCHDIAAILAGLQTEGTEDSTAVVHTSDHGDDVGARGLWGKWDRYNERLSR